MLGGERDDRCRAAKCRRHGGAVEVVGANHPGGGALLDVTMAVDAAGQDQLATRSDLARPGTEVPAECRDDPVFDADVACHDIRRSRHCAVADHEIEIGHARLHHSNPVKIALLARDDK